MMYAVAFLAVLALVAFATRYKRQIKSAFGPEWRIGPDVGAGSPGMPATPTKSGKWWFFDFPTNKASHVHYVQWFKPPALKAGQTLKVRFAVTGGGFVPAERPDSTALVSIVLQRKGDKWSDAYVSHRFYSSKVIELAAGEFEISTPLDPALWTNMRGQNDPVGFAALLGDLSNIGLVFGHGGGRGHGVYASQPSRFTLLDLELV